MGKVTVVHPPSERQAKLAHYAAIHGDWIYELSATEARQYAGLLKALAKLQKRSPKSLDSLAQSVQFESIADCLAERDLAA